MKRPVGIVAVVAVYTVLQIVLWMSTIVPHQSVLHYRYDIAVWVASLLLIPALAVYFSFLICGQRQTSGDVTGRSR